jgi:hypothetical protein
MIKKPIKIFLNYAKEDSKDAERIYKFLTKKDFDVWYSKYSLLAGQNWKQEIQKAIRDCNFFIALISSDSISKTGYVQKELKVALDYLDEMPEGKIFIIPVRLDDSKLTHEKLNNLHWVNLFLDWTKGLDNIIKSINYITKLSEDDKIYEVRFNDKI